MFSIHDIYRQIFRLWRAKRFELFRKKLQPQKSDAMLDVGGYPFYWVNYPPVVAKIDALNLHEVQFDVSKYLEYNIRVVLGDGCHLNSADKSYDIAYSNSVIEHVGSWENQTLFAAELRRVATKIWCQTPARECPIEPHYLCPFIHWLPRSIQRRLIRYFTPYGWIAKPGKEEVDECVESIRLLSKKEMHALFPDCEIMVEYLLPFVPKSYIAIRL